MPVTITVGTMPDRSFGGTLEFISPMGTLVDGAVQFEVRAAVELPDDVFVRATSSANADIVLERRDDVLSIEERLLSFRGERTFVFVPDGQGWTERDVEVGLSDGIRIEVLRHRRGHAASGPSALTFSISAPTARRRRTRGATVGGRRGPCQIEYRMRPLVDRDRLTRFLRELGRDVRAPTRLYLVGGASAVIEGWRSSTADIDLVAEPESRELLESIPRLKKRLDVSVEFASPAHFVPELPGWRDRSQWIEQHGSIQVYHYDFVSQAVAKIERGHRQDLADARRMLSSKVDATRLRELVEQTKDQLLRYPAIEPAVYRAKIDAFLETQEGAE